jgi:tRNA (guanosine-2'-O-)-methyltransferase
VQALTLNQKSALIPYLEQFVTADRLDRFDQIAARRLGHMHIALEDVYQAHNASAVIRSADCFGVQHVHFIENRNKYKISGEVALGASQWVSIHRHTGTRPALQQMRGQGYRIVVTSPHKNDQTLEELDVREKFVLVFGTEKDGVTPEGMELADSFVKIPMMGFTESFNISVCAAICMYELTGRIRQQVPHPGLGGDEKTGIYLDWLLKSIKRSDLLVKDFIKKHPGLSGE